MEYIVVKRDGRREKFDFDKIYSHIKWACEGLNVDENDLIENLKIRMKEEMNSEDIQRSLVITADSLISKTQPDWQYAAARLAIQTLYKDVYGGYNPKFGYDDLVERIKRGIYDSDILDYYTKEEFNELCEIIDFERDMNFTYLGLSQMMKKYGIRRDDKSIETPQEIMFLVPAYNFARIKDKRKRASKIKKYYNQLSKFEIFLSTPPMIGIRTPTRGFTSCAGIHYGDSIESIGNGVRSMMTLVTKLRAGIGVDAGGIRGLDADIANGTETHTGIIPYLKVGEAVSRSSTQPNSGRSGAVTNYYPFFHWEIEQILSLKNNKGSDENSVRFSDHAIVFNDLFYERLREGKDITVFHMNEVGDLYENIGSEDFKEQYETLERKRGIKKKKYPASYIYDRYFNERYITAREYKTNATIKQRHGAFNLPNYKSNLCTEISIPSFPDENFEFLVNSEEEVLAFVDNLYEIGEWYQLYRFIKYNITDKENKIIVKQFKSFLSKTEDGEIVTLNFGEIFSCILGGFNMGVLPKDVEKRRRKIKDMMYSQVYFLDEMIDYQEYAGVEAFEKSTKNRRTLGISPGNLFYFLAKHEIDYDSQEARDLINDVMEEVSFYSIEASMNLAKEKGACMWFADTKYSQGIFPIDTYEKNVDKLVAHNPKMPWDELKEQVLEHGMRNSTLLTAVPSSNSSRPANMISGINPPQALEYNIEDQKMKISGVLPEIDKYLEFYQRHICWDIDIIEYWKLIAIFQKWIDQSISLNEYVDFTKFKDMKIPQSEVYRRDLFTTLFGIESVYYAKTKTDEDAEELQEEQSSACGSGGCEL